MSVSKSTYRGRIAPSPTGYLHLGHARTFWVAQERAKENGGVLILRNEDLDHARCRPEFVAAMFEDLRWFGFEWQEGPDCGGPFAPYNQSERMELYRAALEKLREGNFIYACDCSRKDIQAAARAPHAADDEEPLYPGTCRDNSQSPIADSQSSRDNPQSPVESPRSPIATPLSPVANRKSSIVNRKFSWRFRVPNGETISFTDARLGPQRFVAGKDFGDFVVWRPDDVPAYQLACVVDDAAMKIGEVVRGADLLLSTARQLLLYRALDLTVPGFFHCELLTDEKGVRLAKRHDALSLRTLRATGSDPAKLRAES